MFGLIWGFLTNIRDWLDRKLVPTWRIWWKLWSMRLGALAAMIVTYISAVPSALQEALALLPPWLRDSVPVWLGPLTLLILFFARFWNQSKISQPKPDPLTQHGAE